MLLALSKYADDGDEIARLIEIAAAADTIDQGAVDVLVALDYEWRAPGRLSQAGSATGYWTVPRCPPSCHQSCHLNVGRSEG